MAQAACLLTLVLAGSCAPSSDSVQEPSAPLFATQAAAAGEREVFEALYEGPVLEQRGCLRLDSDSAHTVVWPPGFELRVADGRYRVLDEGGIVVGTVGERFRLGGGELPRGTAPELADPELRRELLARCPGPYWLVGNIMPHQR